MSGTTEKLREVAVCDVVQDFTGYDYDGGFWGVGGGTGVKDEHLGEMRWKRKREGGL